MSVFVKKVTVNNANNQNATGFIKIVKTDKVLYFAVSKFNATDNVLGDALEMKDFVKFDTVTKT